MNLDSARGPILYLDGVTVSFDGFKALDNLSLIVEPGEHRQDPARRRRGALWRSP
jgi:ABC-type uncharacterized transport system ATPase subunit